MFLGNTLRHTPTCPPSFPLFHTALASLSPSRETLYQAHRRFFYIFEQGFNDLGAYPITTTEFFLTHNLLTFPPFFSKTYKRLAKRQHCLGAWPIRHFLLPTSVVSLLVLGVTSLSCTIILHHGMAPAIYTDTAWYKNASSTSAIHDVEWALRRALRILFEILEGLEGGEEWLREVVIIIVRRRRPSTPLLVTSLGPATGRSAHQILFTFSWDKP